MTTTTKLERQVADDPYWHVAMNQIAETFPKPVLMRCPCYYVDGQCDSYDFSWWEQDEDEWDVYTVDADTSYPQDAYDHLTMDEWIEYLEDRSRSL